MALGKNVKRLREAKGMDQTTLSRLSGVPVGSISALEVRDSVRSQFAAQLAKALGVTTDELTEDGAAMSSTAVSRQLAAYGAQPVAVFDDGDVLSDDYIQIKEFEIKFSAGNGRTPVFDELADSVSATYRREWFHRMGINPARAIRVKVHGDSMEPFLFDGDTVLVNMAETNIINGKVYALRYVDELRIKRVYRKLDGGLILHSDNPDFLPRDEDVPASVAQEHIGIVGRVRESSGSGGL